MSFVKKSKTMIVSMIAGAALGATASMLAMRSPKTTKSMTKTAGNAIKAVGNFVEHMNF